MEVFRKLSDGILMLCKDKMHIIKVQKLLLLRIFRQNKPFSNKMQKYAKMQKNFLPKSTLNNDPIAKSF